MQKTTKEVCPDCGTVHADAPAELRAELDSIQNDIDRITEKIIDAVEGEPAQAVALALITAGGLALKDDIAEATEDEPTRIAWFAATMVRFFQECLQAVTLTDRKSKCEPTRTKYPKLAELTIDIARKHIRVQVVQSERVSERDPGTGSGKHGSRIHSESDLPDLRSIPDDAFHK